MSRRMRAAKLNIQEFIEEKEDKDRDLLDFIQKSHQPSDQDKSSMRFTIGKSQTEISKGGLIHRGFTYPEYRDPMHCGIEKLEATTSGKAAVI
jgi:hypothetical protein